MKLDLLISEFHAAERALAQAVRAGRRLDETAALLKRSADILDRIEQFVPVTNEDRRDKAFFFLRRGLSGGGIAINDRDIDIALALSPGVEPPHSGISPRDRADEGGGTGQDLIAYVRSSTERVSIIDQDFRYIATSDANAQYHGTRPVRMIGSRVSVVIGRERFDQRARARLIACFEGQAQEYYHRDGDEGDARILRCQMKPARLGPLGPVALVFVTDVTDDVAKGITAEPFLPKDRYDPGTTA